MSCISLAVVLLSAWLGPPTDPRRLVAFFEKVAPPGWWDHTARHAGVPAAVPRAQFARGAALVFCAAASAYGLLIGAGTLLLQPERWPGAIVILLVTVAVIALWRRLARRPRDLRDWRSSGR
jgi:hypothetical protein